MVDADKNINANFFQLVLSLQVAAMQQMGKIASPITGKVDRNLDQARASIDMLAMLSEKTKNNLVKEEEDLINRVLYELRMNYMEESKKPEARPEESKKEEARESESEESKEKTSGNDNQK